MVKGNIKGDERRDCAAEVGEAVEQSEAVQRWEGARGWGAGVEEGAESKGLGVVGWCV